MKTRDSVVTLRTPASKVGRASTVPELVKQRARRGKDAVKRVLFLLLLTFIAAAQATEHVVRAADPAAAHRQLVIGCNNGQLSASFEWAVAVGTPGAYLRHLLLPGPLGDTHVLLKVLEGRTKTGTASDAEAKELLQLIIGWVDGARIHVEVFPEGRDQDLGDWEGAAYDREDLLAAVKAAAEECQWNISKPSTGTLRTVSPGQAY